MGHTSAYTGKHPDIGVVADKVHGQMRSSFFTGEEVYFKVDGKKMRGTITSVQSKPRSPVVSPTHR